MGPFGQRTQSLMLNGRRDCTGNMYGTSDQSDRRMNVCQMQMMCVSDADEVCTQETSG